MKQINLAISALFIGLTMVSAQRKPQPVKEDLKKLSLSDSELGYWKGLYPENLNNVQLLPSGEQYSYLKLDLVNRDNPQDTIFIKNTGLQRMAIYVIPCTEIRNSLKGSTRFYGIEWKNDEEMIIKNGQNIFTYNYKTKKGQTQQMVAANAANQDYHAKANVLAYTEGNNLYVVNSRGTVTAVDPQKDENIVTGQAIHRFEFGISKGTFWSPYGNKLAFYRKDESNVADYPLLDINTTPGTLKSIKYPMAGQKSEFGQVGVYNVSTKSTTFLKVLLKEEHYVTNVTWGPKEKFVYVAVVNRGQNHVWFNKYDANTGQQLSTLFEETSKEWAEPEHEAYFIPGKSDEFLWLSERDGFMNIYHYNTSGTLIKQLTNNKWVTKNIIGFSENGALVYYEGTGPDARQNHLFVSGLKKGKQVQLTTTEGVHHPQLSKKGNMILDSWSNLGTPRKIDVFSTTGKNLKNILTAPNPLSNYELGITEFGELQAEDGQKLYTRMIKPANFNPKEQYPVLVYVYGGPHAQLITNDWLGGARLWMHYMASQGYIVYTLDGRGSANRGYDFEKVIHRQLGTNEMKDQMVGVEYLKTLPYVDANRMAVHGWSFGGFMTTSLMTRYPGVFTTGVAGGPVIDWKWYEVMYGERYMDTPEENPEGYATASLMQYVGQLEGELLMIHGTVDDVVVMQHNLAFVQACVDKGVQIDFFPYPNHPHNVRGKDRVHLMTKVLNYVMKSLEE